MIEPASPAPASGLHWVLPFASSLSEPCRHALALLDQDVPPRPVAQGRQTADMLARPVLPALPNLRHLMGRMGITARLEGDEYALAMPHERLLGAEMGWPVQEGLMPWAAWWAARDGVTLQAGAYWGMLSPGHWLMGRDHLTLLDPQNQGLGEDESRQLLEAVRHLFESEGWTLHWGAPTRWYASHDSLAGLPTASLDRVIGRNPDVWLTGHPQARKVRRLQSEVQMLLYQHPINDEREARGQSTVNSFWLSGCGRPPATLHWAATTHLVDTLRTPLLADDMHAWLEAWGHVDGTALKAVRDALDAGQDVKLTLCGERHAVTLAARQDGFGAKLKRSLSRLTRGGEGARPATLLASL
jgi:hypothetical protein